MSWDGSVIVLQDTDGPGRYLAVPLHDAKARPTLLRPQGLTRFEAVSRDGGLLYLREQLDTAGRSVSRLRAVDLRTGRELRREVPMDSSGDGAITGEPVARVTTATVQYTVYVRGDVPFVHALGLRRELASARLDLPSAAVSGDEVEAWNIAAAADGSVAVAANGRLGLAFVVRPDGSVQEIRLLGRWNGPPAIVVGAGSQAYVRTVAGLEAIDLLRTRWADVTPAPNGTAVLVAVGTGVLVLDAGWRPLAGFA
jgi:hypothetical protein